MPQYTVGASRDLPINTTGSWDGGKAAQRVFAWAGFDGENPEPEKARTAFLLYDASEPGLKGSYKLPFADIIGGRLTAMASGLRAAASRLPQTEAPEEAITRARAIVDGYFSRLQDQEETARALAFHDKKAPEASIKDLDSEGRFSIVGSTFGNEDSDGDIILPGAYTETIRLHGPQGQDLIKMVWQHDYREPVGRFTDLRETSSELIADGVISKTRRGRDLITLYQDGVINQHSVRISHIARDMEDERKIIQARLWEISPVTWGANPITPLLDLKHGAPVATVQKSLFDQAEIVSRALQSSISNELGEELEATLKLINILALSIDQRPEPDDTDQAAAALFLKNLRALETASSVTQLIKRL